MTPLRDLVGRELKHGIQLPAWLGRLLSLGIVQRTSRSSAPALRQCRRLRGPRLRRSRTSSITHSMISAGSSRSISKRAGAGRVPGGAAAAPGSATMPADRAGADGAVRADLCGVVVGWRASCTSISRSAAPCCSSSACRTGACSCFSSRSTDRALDLAQFRAIAGLIMPRSGMSRKPDPARR